MATATRSSTLGISVKLGHSHGVKVSHPSMSRVCATSPPASCARPAAYRGRAMNAWAAGVDGVYIFNFFDPKSRCGSSWATRWDWRAERHTSPASAGQARCGAAPRFLNVSTLNPATPSQLRQARTSVELGSGKRPWPYERAHPSTAFQIAPKP